MTTGDLLLQNILNNPACDTARLVYADWLDEYGYKDHAQMIRMQLGIVPMDKIQKRRLQQRLHRKWAVWHWSIRTHLFTRRGFVKRVMCDGNGLPTVSVLFKTHPVEEIILYERKWPEFGFAMGHQGPATWRKGVEQGTAPFVRPDFFQYLPHPEPLTDATVSVTYAGWEEAVSALSLALVTWCKVHIGQLPKGTRNLVIPAPIDLLKT